MRLISRILAAPLLGIIHLYRLTLSPLVGGQCRYHPTCSIYGLEAIRTHGPFWGSWLTFTRICRCNPFSKGGFDPVPPPANVSPSTDVEKKTPEDGNAAAPPLQ